VTVAHEQERDEAERRSSPSGAIVYEAVKKEGVEELGRRTAALGWSGLAAGLSMGFSFAAEGLLRHALPDGVWVPLVAKLGYSVGFLIVVLGRQQLFTENTLTVILPLLRRRDSLTLKHVLRLWAIVLGANLVGAWLFATVAARTTMFDPDVRGVFDAIAQEAMAPGAATVMLRGIFAGWLIALMVWLLPFAESARVGVIIVITYVVGIGSFSHVIAGSVETFYLVASGAQSFGQYAFGYLLPSLVGNVIGGTSLVAAIAHAQYVGGAEAIDV
jgi:formate/nitrite transporter FocA (FNT family)